FPYTTLFRSVDVQERAARQGHALELRHEARREAGGDVEAKRLAGPEVELEGARLLRDRDARQTEDDRLERRGHRARVRDVIAQVRAVVDPRDHEVGLEALDQPEACEADAVH